MKTPIHLQGKGGTNDIAGQVLHGLFEKALTWTTTSVTDVPPLADSAIDSGIGFSNIGRLGVCYYATPPMDLGPIPV